MREISVAEQRYNRVLAVIADGRTVGEVARDWGVCRQTLHCWLARYERDGLEGLSDRSHRPGHCPHQTPPEVEVMVLEMLRSHAYWGARRIALELARKGVEPPPSESAVYRCLVRAAVIDLSHDAGVGRPGSAGSEQCRWSSGSWTLCTGSSWLTDQRQGPNRNR
jgi:transposase